MELDLLANGSEYISAGLAAKKVGYSADYIGQLCRAQKLPGKLVGRTWYVELQALLDHKSNRRLGKPRGLRIAPKPSEGSVFVSTLSGIPKGGMLSYETDDRPLLPIISKEARVMIDPDGFDFSLAKQAVAFALTFVILITSGVAMHDRRLAQLSLSQAASVSLFDKFAEAAEAVVGGFRNLKNMALGGVIPSPVARTEPRFAQPVENFADAAPVAQAVMQPGAPALSIESLRGELKSEFQNYIAAQLAGIAPVVYQSGPTFNTTVLRSEILSADTRPAVARQSDSDSSRTVSLISRVTTDGEFTNPTISGGSIFNAVGQFNSLTITDATSSTFAITGDGAGLIFSGVGNHDIFAQSGTLRIGSNVIIGNIEALNNTIDIGDPGTRFDKIYANEVNATTLVGTLTGGNLIAETFAINSDNATADMENAYLAFTRGLTSPNALVTWDATNDKFAFNSGLDITNTIGSAYGLLVSGGKVGFGTTTPAVSLDVYGTDGIRIPVGTNAQRPTGLTGIIRFNTTSHSFEGYGDTGIWQGLGGVIDTDQDTYITADTGGVDEDALRFYTAGTQKVAILSSGNVGIGTTTPLTQLSVNDPAGTDPFSVGSSTPKFIIKDSGKIGIGTANPAGKLSLSGSWPTGSKAFQITDTDGTEVFSLYANGSNLNTLFLRGWGGATIRTNDGEPLAYSVTNAYHSFTTANLERMRITSGGGIGIGTSTAPALLTINDPAGTDSLYVGSSTPKFIIKDSGRVGIGTNNPGFKLEVVGEIRGDTFSSAATSGTATRLTFKTPVGGSNLSWLFNTRDAVSGAWYLDIKNEDDPGITLRQDGLVGINQTAPTAFLEVRGQGTNGEGLVWGHTNPNYASSLGANTTDGLPFLAFFGRAGSGDNIKRNLGGFGVGAISADTSGNLYLRNAPSGTADANVSNFVNTLTLLNTGKVGVGTTTPYAKLSITGSDSGSTLIAADAIAGFAGNIFDLKIASSTKFVVNSLGMVGVGTSTPDSLLQVYTSASQPALSVLGTDGVALSLRNTLGADSWILSNFLTAAGTSDFRLGWGDGNTGSTTAEYFTISHAGNVGMNVASSSAVLAVANGAWNDQFRVGSTSAAVAYAQVSGGVNGSGPTLSAQGGTNLLRGSETLVPIFSGPWVEGDGVTGTNDAATAPNGTLTADKLTERAQNSGHYEGQSVAKSAVSQAYTASVYVKPAGRSIVYIQLANGGTGGATAYYNLATGAVGSLSTYGSGYSITTASISTSTNGYYRLRLTTPTTDAGTNLSVNIGIATTMGSGSYVGDGSSGVYLWGAQLEQSTSLDTYVYSGSTAVTNSNIALNLTGKNSGNIILNGLTNGLVAIGTTTPNNKLDIFGTSTSAIGFSGASGSTYKWTLGMNTAAGGIFSIASSSALGTTDRFVIDGNGNIGIGTTSPLALLTLNDPAGTDPFRVGSSTLKFVIKDSGNVGIGTANPAATLHVRTGNGEMSRFVSTATNGSYSSFYKDTSSVLFWGGRSAITGAGGTTDGIVAGGHSGDGGHLFIYGNYNVDTSAMEAAAGVFRPIVDNAMSVGDGSHRWSAVYAVNGTIQTSDEREKRNILDTDLGLDFIMRLRPVSYEYNDIAGQREGLIAQEVIAALEGHPFEGGLMYSSSTDRYGLNYAAFVSPLIKAVQEIAHLTGTFKDALIAWFADTTNGIVTFFAKEVHTEKLCVKKSDGSDICVTGDELAAFVSGSASNGGIDTIIANPPTDESNDDAGNASSTLENLGLEDGENGSDTPETAGDQDEGIDGGDAASSTDNQITTQNGGETDAPSPDSDEESASTASSVSESSEELSAAQ